MSMLSKTKGDRVVLLAETRRGQQYEYHEVDSFDLRDVRAIQAMARCSQDAAANAMRELNERSTSDRAELVRGLAAWHRGERNLTLSRVVRDVIARGGKD